MIPFLYRVFIQPTRLRVVDLPVQSISTKDDKTITFKGILTYSIKDIYKLYNTVSHPEMTIGGMTMAAISEYIKSRNVSELSIDEVETDIVKDINAKKYGLGNFSIKITSWANVRTYRLIQDSSWMNEQMDMNYIGQRL
jgi:regulator of protease activity HflC (stomatin/prohibitin superfamily)